MAKAVAVGYDIELEEGEELVLKEFFQLKHGEPFAFALSNRAAYLPAKKFIAKDPWYFRKVPLSQIQHVSLERMKPYGVWFLAAVLIVVGGVTAYWMFQPRYPQEDRTVSGIPFGVLAVGLALPFVVRGRRRLIVELVDGLFQWKGPLVLDRASRLRIREIQEGILAAFEQLHVPVMTESGSRHGLPSQ